MATNEESCESETEQAIDEAALNEEASRELAAMVAEAEQSSTRCESRRTTMMRPLYVSSKSG